MAARMDAEILTAILAAVGQAYSAGLERWEANGVSLSQAGQGMNNALYRVWLADAEYACKLCVSDERQRSQREAGALRWLEMQGLDLGPRLVGLDESLNVVPYPAVLATWLPGRPLAAPFTPPELAGLVDSLQQMHACHPSAAGGEADLLPAHFHWREPAPYLADVNTLKERYIPWLRNIQPGGPENAQRLQAVLDAASPRLAAPQADELLHSAPLCLVHVDPTPANALLGQDGRVRWVDWEYSGWGDPALDLADLLWHEGFDSLDPAQRTWLMDSYQPVPDDTTFYVRLAYWENLLSVRWALLLLRSWWAAKNGADRLRLGRIPSDPIKQRGRFLDMVRRAERFYGL